MTKTTRAALAALCMFAAAAPGFAAGKNSAEFVWTVHLGGLSLGTIGFKSEFEGQGYAAVTKLKTSGVLNSFYGATIDASSSGLIEAGRIQPVTYNSMYAGEKSTQRVQLAYAGGAIKLDSEPQYNVTRFPVSDEQKANTVDPISGMVQAVSGVTLSPQRPCGGTVRVFDGKRRFDIELSFVEETELKSTSGGYSGKATLCNAAYKQVAGFKQELTNKEPPPVQIWLAKFPAMAGGPLTQMAVPVKLQAETPFGVAVANARNILVDGQAR